MMALRRHRPFRFGLRLSSLYMARRPRFERVDSSSPPWRSRSRTPAWPAHPQRSSVDDRQWRCRREALPSAADGLDGTKTMIENDNEDTRRFSYRVNVDYRLIDREDRPGTEQRARLSRKSHMIGPRLIFPMFRPKPMPWNAPRKRSATTFAPALQLILPRADRIHGHPEGFSA